MLQNGNIAYFGDMLGSLNIVEYFYMIGFIFRLL